MTKKHVTLALAWALAASAQQPFLADGGAKTSATTMAVFETVFVRNKSGQPVSGLRKEDFTVTEDGKPQNISFFDYEDLSARIAPASGAQLPAHDYIAPDWLGELRYKNRRLLVLFFDIASMSPPDRARAQAAAQKFITTQMTASDLIAIATFSDEVKVLQDFTDDRDLLSEEIDSLSHGAAQNRIDDAEPFFAPDETEFNIFNNDRRLSALEWAAQVLAALREKKALVYFTAGLNGNYAENEAQRRATINAAGRSNVVFYPIDSRGRTDSDPSAQETLRALASGTGGESLLDNNDLSIGIRQAQKDIGSYYIIGYYSSNYSLDGQFRNIDIKLKPHKAPKSSTLDYRRGYYAPMSFSKFTGSDKDLANVLMLGDPITDIRIAAEVDYFRLARDRYLVPLWVKIPIAEVILAKQEGATDTTIDFIGRVADDKDKEVQAFHGSVDIKLSGETIDTLRSRGPIAYHTSFVLPPERTTSAFSRERTRPARSGPTWPTSWSPTSAAPGFVPKLYWRFHGPSPLCAVSDGLSPHRKRAHVHL